MIDRFNSFQSMVNSHSLKIRNGLLNKCIYNFNYYLILNENQNLPDFTQKAKQSQIMIVDQYIYEQEKYFIICFDSTLIIINETELYKTQQLFENQNSTIYFIKSNIIPFFLNQLQNIRAIKNKNINLVDLDDYFESEIESFSEKLILNQQKNMKFWKTIRRSISGYFIKQSYNKSRFNRIENNKEMINNNPKTFNIQNHEYIHLRNIGGSNISHVDLIYHIEREELFVAKIIFDSEEPKLFPRELNNYFECHHPFLSRYYGTIEIGNKKYLGIEYIQGHSLSYIHEMKLNFYEKVRILFEIMLAIEYIHNKGFIYRDLKPNNIMIDIYKTAILIDFDRMIKNEIDNTDENSTKSFDCEYGAPEILTNQTYSNEVDIYSLGRIINFIFFQNGSQEETKSQPYNIYTTIEKVNIMCIQKDPNNRPKIKDLIYLIYNNCILSYYNNNIYIQNKEFLKYWGIIAEYSFPFGLNNIGMLLLSKENIQKYYQKGIRYLTIAADQHNIVVAQHNLGYIYSESTKTNSENIYKSIHYYTLAANNNYRDSQYDLGIIYYEGRKCPRNIDKAYHYLTLAANQNHVKAQYFLGCALFIGQYFPRDINKSFYYMTLSANQNYAEAQYKLGVQYLNGKFIAKDINKSIYYLTQSANQGHSYAQLYLGVIYYKGINGKQDINKAINYFLLASYQNLPEANFYLGVIYYEGKNIISDYKKAIYYISKAADYNYIQAVNYLGFIYYDGKYFSRDMKKAISYWKIAADQGYSISQFNLGRTYFEGKFVPKDINKAINYLEMAANQQYEDAQFYLGCIYYEGKYVQRNIKLAFNYLKNAADKNYLLALIYLGFIYYNGEYITRDINKSIYYFTLAADQKSSIALYNLGNIYYNGKYIPKDVKKAIHYITLAANNNESIAYYQLGYIYLKESQKKEDIDLAIHYLTLAANLNQPQALSVLATFYIEGTHVKQNINKGFKYLNLAASNGLADSLFDLGFYYYQGKYVKKNINKAIYYLKESANKYYSKSQYLLGNIYEEGIYVDRNMKECIKYYKEASSLNNHYAKNNLGIIFKNGYETEKNQQYSIELFEESIRISNDPISKYNLSHLYFFETKTEENNNKSIQLLIESIDNKFEPSKYLLILILIHKYNPIKRENIQKEINQFQIQNGNLINELFELIKCNNFENKTIYSNLYEDIKKKDYTYHVYSPVISNKFINNIPEKSTKINITKEFYEGFDLI